MQSMTEIDDKIEFWKKQLLDLGRRNRLISYKETKNSNIKIVRPNYDDLYKKLVISKKQLRFPYTPPKALEDEEDIAEFTKGDIATDKSINEQQKILGSLRTKSKEGFEEQGMNTLYLSFGFLNWNDGSGDITSPLVLVPVSLSTESIADPFIMELADEPIVVNPLLLYKLKDEYNIIFPEFNQNDENLKNYLDSVSEIVSQKGWNVDEKAELALLSFLRISMHQDLEQNSEKLKNNPIVKAICGDNSELPSIDSVSSQLDHDKHKSSECYQILDADSSQEDALVLARNGISFILEGPPGTGKSQTIANMISEAMADGKRVLFVSEKMAALDIVHKRLSEAGLDDFCMVLHSHKVNKRDILDELKSVLYLDRNPSECNLDDLYALDMEKQALDTYAEELHRVRNPLGLSVYRVCGELSRLQNAKSLDFKLDSISNTDMDTLMKRVFLVRSWSRTTSAAMKQSSWSNCIFKQRPTPGEKEIIKTRLSKMHDELIDISKAVDEVYSTLNLSGLHISLKTLDSFVNSLIHFSKSPSPPEMWLEKDNLELLRENAMSLAALMDEYESIKQRLLQLYDSKILTLPSMTVSEKTSETEMAFLRENLAIDVFADEDGILRGSDRMIRACGEAITALGELEKVKDFAISLIPQGTVPTVSDLIAATEILSILDGPIHPTENWFTEYGRSIRNEAFTETVSKYAIIRSLEQEIFQSYDMQILELPCTEMLNRFKNSQKSFGLRFGQHNADLKTLKNLRTDTSKKLDDAEAINILQKVIRLKEERVWLRANDLDLRDKLGNGYTGETTDFEVLKQSFSAFDSIIQRFNGPVPEGIRRLLLTGIEGLIPETLEIKRIAARCASLIELESSLKNLSLSEMDVQQASTECSRIQNSLIDLKRAIMPMIELSLSPAGYSSHIINMQRLVRLQVLYDLDASKKSAMEAEFGHLYDGLTTDFRRIINHIDWTIEFNKMIREWNIPVEVARSIVNNSDIAKSCEKLADNLFISTTKVEEDAEWFESLFSISINALDMNFNDLDNRVIACLDEINDIDEQADFNRTTEDCKYEGLSSYMSVALKEGLSGEDAVNAFLKKFYSSWLEDILFSSSSLRNLCGKDYSEEVKRFNQLDINQLSNAKVRIRNKVISRLPNIDDAVYSNTELSMLKQELYKQKGGMPAAKLLHKIPNIVMSLKPCMMMSPLSVSLFLQNDDYMFDMVIFDEASQVRTESAIGAIMRAKQAIIVGDVKQLPPTNFFSSSSVDSDSDDDEQFLESILDESHALPIRSLRWHYRSRDESLIAFSNHNIYEDLLITFPSCNHRRPDTGVEYIYVEDGVYDRGKKRCNVKEARRVAELIFEHIENRSSESLGVIAASEAQMQAIESVLNFMRYQNREFEEFFKENKKEPFFIKNIENVQGDERDVIIFSLGYGKDTSGKMYMNFGPLSKKGGTRRLNVAVTRARSNLKFVASILPEDIDAYEGDLGMVRSYIEYASHGSESLDGDTEETGASKSIFEESICEFIQMHGYLAKPRIGCSGYRVDIGVANPSDPENYILGIECDGFVYNSARTARERERLRYDMLRSMGWNIYRLHALDWVRDPESAGNDLLKQIQSAISNS